VKTLTLLRHAKSSGSDPTPRDFDRPINGRGRRAAARMGEWLAGDDLPIDLIIASPALRVQQTLAGVLTAAKLSIDARFEPRIYLASAATLLELIQGIEATAKHVLMMGHNPGLEDLVLLLSPEGGALRAEAELKYPTATLARLEFEINDWAQATEAMARLTEFVRPRDLDVSLGPDD
jgi:phosphohistidine phosphatase